MSGARAKPQGIYIVGSSGDYNWEFSNWDRLQLNGRGLGLNYGEASWPDSMLDLPRGPWRIPDYIETPKLIVDQKRKMKDLYSVEYFLFISDKMKGLLDQFAPKSCEYMLCDTKFADGETGPAIWLCSVVDSYRNAVDLEKSEIRVSKWGTYLISGESNWQFLPAVLDGEHLFRLVECANLTFCDQAFKDICKIQDIKGISFRQVGLLLK
ncbi:Protein of unknown function (DUF1629) [Rhizobium leguminosarum bv. trifolii WSM2297]|uniref:Immunity MXAN-0049 protein domain-containing protein n=1 Tax=Rhizobium leguminosarum bv. trifolii WSM2297 TaxID=754762 RepID=J0W0S7_RHILT|nr:DUF1629 domain-containing protein [Rhizobium leguminosarum]EJC79271.1 Protein of unknown function (DUF1629) [Rhizobium leguminosarum bv. trifolii WSM2297]